jgi:tRNA-dihydrouridine synthase
VAFPYNGETISLAPMQGLTEVEFRRAYSNLFSGIDFAVSPFIPLAQGIRFRITHLHDVIPKQNARIPVVPQVLGNDPGKFLHLAQRLNDLGYETVNWNLGCPKESVARKQRGSGLLPYPEKIRDVLEKLMAKLPVALSIKTRLGYSKTDEFYELIKVYNDFPLESLIIHPRLGVQMYEGDMHLDVLDDTIGDIKHPVVFSGDISSHEVYEKLKKRYPVINHWMIGRGVLTNPFLPGLIKNGHPIPDVEDQRKKLYNFYDELFCELRDKLRRDSAILGKLKDFWSYFARWFADDEEIFSVLARINSLHDFMSKSRSHLVNSELASFAGRLNTSIKPGK